MRDEILLVGPLPPQIGGVEFFVEALLKSPLREWFTIRHFDISKPKSRSMAQFSSPMGYARSFKRNLKTSFYSFGYSLIYFTKYLFVIPSRRIGLVHLHSSAYMSFWEKCAYLDLARLFGKKVVLHIHGSSFDRFIRESGRFARGAILRHLRRCDRVVALSESWRTFFLEYLAPDKIAVVENGIDLSLYRELEPRPAPVPTVVFLGEVCSRKGIFDLLSAFKKVLATLPDARLVLAGPGELEKSQMVARHLGISDAVEFLGPRYGAAKAAVLSEGWCMALPSYAEVFPLALLDGYAAGLPVVSTRVGGIPDFVQEGENGLLVEPGDQQGLAAALTRLLTETPLRCRMAEANRRVARERYDIDICAQRVREIYQELLRQ